MNFNVKFILTGGAHLDAPNMDKTPKEIADIFDEQGKISVSAPSGQVTIIYAHGISAFIARPAAQD